MRSPTTYSTSSRRFALHLTPDVDAGVIAAVVDMLGHPCDVGPVAALDGTEVQSLRDDLTTLLGLRPNHRYGGRVRALPRQPGSRGRHPPGPPDRRLGHRDGAVLVHPKATMSRPTDQGAVRMGLERGRRRAPERGPARAVQPAWRGASFDQQADRILTLLDPPAVETTPPAGW
jgi:hypothetical protein